MNELENLHENFNTALNKLAEVVSLSIRNLKDKNERVEFLKNMKTTPSSTILKKVNEIAIQNQDYETCDAIKDFCQLKGIII